MLNKLFAKAFNASRTCIFLILLHVAKYFDFSDGFVTVTKRICEWKLKI